MKARGAVVLVLLLIPAGCGGSAHHAAPRVESGPVWTSPAEPSPPGSAGRWSPADEEQLRESAP